MTKKQLLIGAVVAVGALIILRRTTWLKYGTKPGSEQSKSLAEQDAAFYLNGYLNHPGRIGIPLSVAPGAIFV